MLQTNLYFPLIFNFDDEPYSEDFAALGYGSYYIISNLGSLSMIILAFPVIFLIVSIFNKYLPFWNKIKFKKIGVKI